MATVVFRVACLLALTAGLGECISEICPSRRYQLRGNSSCYLHVQSPLSYAAANRSCIRDGAILLNILSAGEDTYVRDNFFVQGGSQEFWIGLNDVTEEGNFRWENSSNQDPSYVNWSLAFPLDNRESLDCVKFASDGWRVHDLPCSSSQLPFVCKSNTCSSQDGENCLSLVTTPIPAAQVSAGGISAIVIVLIVVIAVLVIVVFLVCLWKFKNDVFNRFCCFCCGGAERSKVRNLQQENQRLRQQLSQHRLSVSGRMPPGQFSNALSGVPDGRGGVLPAIKQQLSPTGGEDRLPFLSSPVGSGPPPLNIQRQTPGSFLGGRPLATAPAGASGLPRGLFTGATPVRPVRQSLPIFGGGPPQPLNLSSGTRSGEVKPVAPATLTEEDETESSGSGESESGDDDEGAGLPAKQDSDKNSQQE